MNAPKSAKTSGSQRRLRSWTMAYIILQVVFAATPWEDTVKGQPKFIAYKHTSKTGGMYLEYVLRKLFGDRYLSYGEQPTMNRNHSHFLIGSVREPCAWLVSFWGYSWRQSCRHMYDKTPCTLSTALSNWAAKEYWMSPGACLNLEAVTTCARNQLASCMYRWAGVSEHELVSTRRKQLPLSTVDAFTNALTDGGQRLNASHMMLICPDAGPTPWLNSIDDFREFAYVRAGYETNIMRPFFEQAGMPPGLHETWKRSARHTLPDEMRAHTAPARLADCWVTTERLVTDLLACLREFDRLGGEVDWKKVALFVKPEPINPSEHALCEKLFTNPALIASVESAERGLYTTFGYSSCCAASNDPRVAGYIATENRNRDRRPPAALVAVKSGF